MSKFEKFLRKKGVLTRFKKNLSNGGTQLNFQQITEMVEAFRMVRGAFTWQDSSEGYEFWSKIGLAWKEELE